MASHPSSAHESLAYVDTPVWPDDVNYECISCSTCVLFQQLCQVLMQAVWHLTEAPYTGDRLTPSYARVNSSAASGAYRDRETVGYAYHKIHYSPRILGKQGLVEPSRMGRLVTIGR